MTTQAVSVARIDSKTRFIGILRTKEDNPLQLSMWQKDADEDWYTYMIELASHLNSTFWFSELRALADIGPREPNMYGQLARKLKAHGYRMTGNYRPSACGSRRGGVEAEWQRTIS